MKFSGDIQKLLPLGYLFLVVLGVLKESVFYYQMGISILKYSTLMDILISPIADLTSHPIILLALLFFLGSLYVIINNLSNNHRKEWVRKLIGLQSSNELTVTDVKYKFVLAIYLTFKKGFTPLTIVPIALMPILMINVINMKNIKKELQSRKD